MYYLVARASSEWREFVVSFERLLPLLKPSFFREKEMPYAPCRAKDLHHFLGHQRCPCIRERWSIDMRIDQQTNS